MKNAIKKFWDSEDGMGVVEVVLITIVKSGIFWAGIEYRISVI